MQEIMVNGPAGRKRVIFLPLVLPPIAVNQMIGLRGLCRDSSSERRPLDFGPETIDSSSERPPLDFGLETIILFVNEDRYLEVCC